MKGIILAGGSGTRLYPITERISKQLMNIYDKPMIYYPLSVLMLAGIRDILLITTERDQLGFKRLFEDGSKFGINVNYVIQPSPDGLAQAFVLGREFVGNDDCAMVLGDNIFYESGFSYKLAGAVSNALDGYATIFGTEVKDPWRFGIMELSGDTVKSLEEKPKYPKSNFAVTGLYFYPNDVLDKAVNLKKSARGEYEITDLNNVFLKENRLKAEVLGGGYTWFDTGTFDSQLDACNMIRGIQNNKDTVVACLEEISYRHGWISKEQLEKRAQLMKNNSYGKYLEKVLTR